MFGDVGFLRRAIGDLKGIDKKREEEDKKQEKKKKTKTKMKKTRQFDAFGQRITSCL